MPQASGVGQTFSGVLVRSSVRILLTNAWKGGALRMHSGRVCILIGNREYQVWWGVGYGAWNEV